LSDEHQRRIERLEGCTEKQQAAIESLHAALDLLREELRERDIRLREWMANGVSEKIARVAGQVIVEKLTEAETRRWEREREDRRLQLEEQTARNREYGAKRDAELKEREQQRDHRTRMIIAIVGSLAGIIGAISGLIFKAL